MQLLSPLQETPLPTKILAPMQQQVTRQGHPAPPSLNRPLSRPRSASHLQRSAAAASAPNRQLFLDQKRPETSAGCQPTNRSRLHLRTPAWQPAWAPKWLGMFRVLRAPQLASRSPVHHCWCRLFRNPRVGVGNLINAAGGAAPGGALADESSMPGTPT